MFEFSKLVNKNSGELMKRSSSVFFQSNIQPKLSINSPGDQQEREADTVAARLIGMERPGTKSEISSVQRKCTECEEEEKQQVQRKESDRALAEPDNSLESYVGGLSSSGTPLSSDVRNFYEPRFGFDFSDVKIHTDTVAAKSAQSINALAYTSGNNIVFNKGQYSPKTNEGKRLLGHELTHVVQQSDPVYAQKIQRKVGDGHDLQSARFAGDPLLEACLDNERTLQIGSRGGAVEKVQQALIDADFPLPKFGVDGDFGLETKTALQNFQETNGLTPDGIIGSVTMEKLDAVVVPSPIPPTPQDRELTAEELANIITVAQSAVTPDGNTLGPSDPTHRGCLGNRFFFRKGTFVNTPTGAQGASAVTAQLRQPPAEGGGCSCGCGLFRQFIRGFWRAGSATAAKQFNIGSCGTALTMNETTFTEELVNCITGNAPIGPGCTRTQADAPGALSGLVEGTFFQMHLELRYQMWDQCRGRSLGMADHVLDISGSNSPRTIRFT
jgi:peptidoglycan hydrolase-like protein with peptidoglycan-binding domain